LNDDFEYLKKLLNKVLFKNQDINMYFENENIHWSDDRLIIRSMIKKTIESLNSPNFNTFAFANLSNDIKDDINFASSLFDSTVDNTSEYDEYIIKNSKNWKLDRISLMDKSILRMGIDEMVNFPNIPIKVTMNECIDIAKDYSTPKSGLFINGVLDVISLNLQKKGIIKKSGKGLIDNK
jgi:N utilization substance protein B